MVAVISRRRLTGLGVDGAAYHRVEVFSTEVAVELLGRRLGDVRVAREPVAAERLASLCAGLPLAVSVAAARLAARPARRSRRWRRPWGAVTRAGWRPCGSERSRPCERRWTSPIRRCRPRWPAATGGSGAPGHGRRRLDHRGGLRPLPAEAERLLDHLTEVNLLEDLPPDPRTGRTATASTTWCACTRGRAAAEMPAAEREDAVRRVVDLYLFTATAAEALLSPSHRRLRRDYLHEPVGRRRSATSPARSPGWTANASR
ncbi:hypothetical protein NKH77_35285 [Streptomyces sp. M19]